jgi:hypothetical protein
VRIVPSRPGNTCCIGQFTANVWPRETQSAIASNSMPRDVSIVLGPPPSRLKPILRAQLEALAARRSDVSLRFAETGAKAKRDTVLVDPTGRIPGELLFIDGRLQIRDPAHDTLEWMIELAHELGGRVLDNSLRTYRTARDTYRHPDDHDARSQLASAIYTARKIDRSPKRAKLYPFIWWVTIAAAFTVALVRLLSDSSTP